VGGHPHLAEAVAVKLEIAITVQRYADPRVEARLRETVHKLDLIMNLMEKHHMAGQDSINKLRTDIAALLNEGVNVITNAVAKAQANSNDAAIDQLDNDVTQGLQKIRDAATQLQQPADGGTGGGGAGGTT
jgi:predicted component of type VI protein secretion system